MCACWRQPLCSLTRLLDFPRPLAGASGCPQEASERVTRPAEQGTRPEQPFSALSGAHANLARLTQVISDNLMYLRACPPPPLCTLFALDIVQAGQSHEAGQGNADDCAEVIFCAVGQPASKLSVGM